jgi:hypothetical protein
MKGGEISGNTVHDTKSLIYFTSSSYDGNAHGRFIKTGGLITGNVSATGESADIVCIGNSNTLITIEPGVDYSMPPLPR